MMCAAETDQTECARLLIDDDVGVGNEAENKWPICVGTGSTAAVQNVNDNADTGIVRLDLIGDPTKMMERNCQ